MRDTSSCSWPLAESHLARRLFRHIIVLVFLVGLEPAIGQAPPTENKGLTVGSTVTIDLGPEIGVQGRMLRLRLLTLAQ